MSHGHCEFLTQRWGTRRRKRRNTGGATNVTASANIVTSHGARAAGLVPAELPGGDEPRPLERPVNGERRVSTPRFESTAGVKPAARLHRRFAFSRRACSWISLRRSRRYSAISAVSLPALSRLFIELTTASKVG